MPFNTYAAQSGHGPSAATDLGGRELIHRAREFIAGRLYFACTDVLPAQTPDVHYFTIDDTLVYINFHNDFGPNNISHTLRFIELLGEKFKAPALAGKKLCLYTNVNSDRRANAAYLICAYMLIVHRKTPEQAHAPIDGIQPPFVPFRDAGYGSNTYQITILDCLCGLYKGLVLGLLRLDAFDLQQYEFYERVENGDFNWLTEKFMALASPHDDPPGAPPSTLAQRVRRERDLALQVYRQQAVSGTSTPQSANSSTSGRSLLSQVVGYSTSLISGNSFASGKTPSGSAGTLSVNAPPPMFYSCYRIDDMVSYLKEKNVGTIIRLNNKLYGRKKFVDAGIEHIEMYFPDGSNPPEHILRAFLEIVETRPGPIAIHCKAGLGRTGSLIACYLMKHYLFSASEVIAFMRVMRPGSVVGPQQNWLQGMEAAMWRLHPNVPLSPAISRLAPSTYLTNTRFNYAIPTEACRLEFSEHHGFYSTAANRHEQRLPPAVRSQSFHSLHRSDSYGTAGAALAIRDDPSAAVASAVNQNDTNAAFLISDLTELQSGNLTKAHRSNPNFVAQELKRHYAARPGDLAIPIQPRKGVVQGSADEREAQV